MTEKKKVRFLQKMVTFCIGFIVCIIMGGYFSAWFPGVNEELIKKVIDVTAAVFGGELLLTVVIKLIEPITEKQDKKKEDGV